MPTAKEATRELPVVSRRRSHTKSTDAVTDGSGFRLPTYLYTSAETTDDTAADLVAADGVAGVVIPDNHVAQIVAEILAVQTGGTDGTVGDSSSWIITGTVIREEGVATIAHVDTAVEVSNIAAAGAAAWTATLEVDTTTGAVKVTGTGDTDSAELNKTIKWTARLAVNPVAFA